MYDKFFGELNYNFGFERYLEINIFEQKKKVLLTVQAYNESDLITEKQELAFENFSLHLDKHIKDVEQLLLESYGGVSKERFSVTSILIDRDGELALLFDDKEDADEGIVVIIYPKLELNLQSNYL